MSGSRLSGYRTGKRLNRSLVPPKGRGRAFLVLLKTVVIEKSGVVITISGKLSGMTLVHSIRT
ncbi:hypothetical protein SeseC_01736 [Streptococcus equi subsp. zooepidemicus ATCC 35246]|nr:hypothetical protein SeseC_01736 [Streptococcus equi subsp. zooepidemicus ATCC 35246]